MVFPARPQLSSLGQRRGPGSTDWEEHGFKVGGTFPGQSWPWRERGLLPPTTRPRWPPSRGGRGGGGGTCSRRFIAGGSRNLGSQLSQHEPSHERRCRGKSSRKRKRSQAGKETEGARPAARWEREGLRGGGAERSTVCRTKKEKKTMAGEGFGALHLGRSPHSGPRSKSVWSSLLIVTSTARPRGRRCRRRPEL